MRRQKFPYVELSGVDRRRIVDDPVHDGVSNHSAAKAGMLFTGFILGAEDRRPLVVSPFKNFQKILVFLLSWNVEQPFVNNEEAVIRELCDRAGNAVSGLNGHVQHL